MEQLINNNLMANMQLTKSPQTAKKSESLDKDGFQKLLEQKQGGTEAASSKTERPEAAQKPQEAQKTEDAQNSQETQEVQESQEGQPAFKSEKELEDQMALAAMALLRNPLVADIAEETPQILTDPNWQDGLVPVGYDDYEEQGIRIVHWMQPEGENSENLEEMNNLAGELAEELTETETEAKEIPVEAPEFTVETKAAEVEIKVETGTVAQEEDSEDTPELRDAEVETPVFEDVKAVPVKVGESHKTETPKPVEEQIVPKITEALESGETRVELQLTPENLGKVTVEMTLKQDGGLVVQIHAENRDTQNLLSKNMSGLEALLSRETQQEVRVEVPRQEESQRQDLYEQQQEHQRRQQQERREHREQDSEAFMQQLRLGLIPVDEE